MKDRLILMKIITFYSKNFFIVVIFTILSIYLPTHIDSPYKRQDTPKAQDIVTPGSPESRISEDARRSQALAQHNFGRA